VGQFKDWPTEKGNPMTNERSEEQQGKDYEKLRQEFLSAFSFAAHNEISPPLAAFCVLELVVDMLKSTSPNKQAYKHLMVQLWKDLVDVKETKNRKEIKS
jgi:hypothetical protein